MKILELTREMKGDLHRAKLVIEKNGKQYKIETESENEISENELLTEIIDYED